jgi:hypothetical protein
MSALKQLTEQLEQDRRAPYPKYPDQAVYALRDEAVAQAIERRFKNHESLVRIKSLGCHQASGLLHTVFEFTRAGAIALAPSAVLVITDSHCKVVGMVDPFDSEQPNPMLPAQSGVLPLALSQPSGADELGFSEEDLRPREERTRAFLKSSNVETDSGGVTPRFYAVDTMSEIGYKWQYVLSTVNAMGKRTYEWVKYPVSGADDSGVGGDGGGQMSPV